ncbi:hypothetical protein LZG04_11415 [Saccharothrix sp. S26]|uniref:hypothetical protein n=1 Tax=Saccharothrix sp. S26 TaxID=2907215 RepID=UPI001F489BF8|nr:hypothetical protein [Saccharothrix sp. S26]MCE6995410.1 hypothetical protein [Saccharothrix sp. S26]
MSEGEQDAVGSAISGAVPPRSREAEGRLLLRRLVAPLVRAGWSEATVEEWYDDEDPDRGGAEVAEVTVELERSGFHLLVSWNPVTGLLVVADPTEGWDWDDGLLPPLFPLDEEITVDLAGESSQAVRAETARRAFAAAGLLDATRIRLSEPATFLHADLVMSFRADYVHDAAIRHRGRDDLAGVYASLGEEFSWRIASGMRAYPLIVPAAVPSAAARGIAEWCWRRESVVEEWHHKVDDLTMARANIAATRAVLPHVHLEGVDWPAVRLALTFPGRRLADGRALVGLFDDGWEPILASIHGQVDLWQRAEDELGPQTVLALLSMHGSRTESVGDWWGSGHFETLTRLVIENGAQVGKLPRTALELFADADRFADIAAHAPDVLDDDLLYWLTRAIFDEQSRRRIEGEPDTAVVTLPDWVTEELTELLTTDRDDTSS